MFVAQGFLLFHPTSLSDDEQARLEALPDVEPLRIEVQGATLQGFFVHGVGDGRRPTVLYFGGNAQPVWRQLEAKRWVAAMGFNLAFMSYRGYDRSTGSPSGEALTGDGRLIYDALSARDDVDPARIVTWGFSLGTGVACHVACHRPVAGVILMAPYDSLAAVAAAQYPLLPVRLLFRHEIDSAACAPKVEAPALIVHGEADEVIATSHGAALAEAWGGDARFLRLDGVGHNDISSHAGAQPEISAFLRSMAH